MSRLLPLKEVLELTTLSRGSVYNLIKRGQFPRPVSIAGIARRKAWREADVRAWIEAQA